MDRIAQELTPLGTIDYTYDADGRRASMTVAGEPVVNYAYDDAGRLTGLSRDIGGTVRTYNLGYDNANRRTTLSLPLTSGNVATAYGYDIANRLLSMLIQGPSAQVENLTYSYDPNGNRTSFTRNATQPLASAMSGTSHDSANEMLAYNSKTLTYDANGNMTSDGTNTYTWDARNRLTAISGPSLTASFSYDALGRRVSKTINSTTTQYLYDRWDIIQEIQGSAKTNYVRTLNIDEPLTRIKPDGTVRHYVQDALGSVIALTDDTGVVKTTYTYGAFGTTTVSGETSDNPFQYTGRENDGTGLYYYRHRYYSLEMHRFISEDPIGIDGDSLNFYSYTEDNPINNIDPYGLFDAVRFGAGAFMSGAGAVIAFGGAYLYTLLPAEGAEEGIYALVEGLSGVDTLSRMGMISGLGILIWWQGSRMMNDAMNEPPAPEPNTPKAPGKKKPMPKKSKNPKRKKPKKRQ